jgi:hypothetical protein
MANCADIPHSDRLHRLRCHVVVRGQFQSETVHITECERLSNSLLVGSGLVMPAHTLSLQNQCFTLVRFVAMFTSLPHFGRRMCSRSKRINSFGGTLYPHSVQRVVRSKLLGSTRLRRIDIRSAAACGTGSRQGYNSPLKRQEDARMPIRQSRWRSVQR